MSDIAESTLSARDFCEALYERFRPFFFVCHWLNPNAVSSKKRHSLFVAFIAGAECLCQTFFRTEQEVFVSVFKCLLIADLYKQPTMIEAMQAAPCLFKSPETETRPFPTDPDSWPRGRCDKRDLQEDLVGTHEKTIAHLGLQHNSEGIRFESVIHQGTISNRESETSVNVQEPRWRTSCWNPQFRQILLKIRRVSQNPCRLYSENYAEEFSEVEKIPSMLNWTWRSFIVGTTIPEQLALGLCQSGLLCWAFWPTIAINCCPGGPFRGGLFALHYSSRGLPHHPFRSAK
jgi:hypothetical protein